MAHHPSDDSSASPRLRRIRKLIAEAKRKQRREIPEPHAGRGPIKPPSDLAPVWTSALSRVKKHIQTGRRPRHHAD